MTTKLLIEVNQNGEDLDMLVKIIGNHNSGTAKITLEDIAGYIKCRKSIYPNLHFDIDIEIKDQKLTLPFCVITEIEIHQLQPVENNGLAY